MNTERQITITLAKIKERSPCVRGWKAVLKANGGSEADLSKLFPLSSILDSNGLTAAIWSLRCLPEHNRLWLEFAKWCAEQGDNAKDARVKQALAGANSSCDCMVGVWVSHTAWAARNNQVSVHEWELGTVTERTADKVSQELKLRSILDLGAWEDK